MIKMSSKTSNIIKIAGIYDSDLLNWDNYENSWLENINFYLISSPPSPYPVCLVSKLNNFVTNAMLSHFHL